MNFITKFQFITGDITETTAPIIVQQVNCKGKMGKGLAKAIADKWPVVKKEYEEVCTMHSPEELLGAISFTRIGEPDNKIIVNLFGQLSYKKANDPAGKCYTNYQALDIALLRLASLRTRFKSMNIANSIAIPYYIGSGLGGGDSQRITSMIVGRLYGHYDIQFYLKPGETIPNTPRYRYFKYGGYAKEFLL